MPRRIKLTNPAEVQALADAFFAGCAGQPLYNDNGEIVLDRNSRPVIVGEKPPTTTGLAIALGFDSRQEMLDFRGRREVLRIIKRACSLCEEYLETRLFDKEGMKGAEFILRCNFNWSENVKPAADNEVSDDPLSASLRRIASGLDEEV